MLILGSKSPRRKEILEMAQIPFKTELIDVKEDVIDSDAKSYVMKTALKKGEEYISKFPNDTILCADTIVDVDNKVLEKPKSRIDAFNMIKLIQGRFHYVHTGVFLGNKDHYDNFIVSTKVYVCKMSDDEINNYVDTKEPYDKAGSYAIQGIFAKYIEKIEGDYYNVMGLPLHEIVKRIKGE